MAPQVCPYYQETDPHQPDRRLPALTVADIWPLPYTKGFKS
jgi:hypothetical protein